MGQDWIRRLPYQVIEEEDVEIECSRCITFRAYSAEQLLHLQQTLQKEFRPERRLNFNSSIQISILAGWAADRRRFEIGRGSPDCDARFGTQAHDRPVEMRLPITKIAAKCQIRAGHD